MVEHTYDSIANTIAAWMRTVMRKAHVQVVLGLYILYLRGPKPPAAGVRPSR
jgi:hypothetical protein